MLQFRKCFTQRTQSIQRRKGFFHATPQRRNAAREISYDVVNVSIPELSHATTQRRNAAAFLYIAASLNFVAYAARNIFTQQNLCSNEKIVKEETARSSRLAPRSSPYQLFAWSGFILSETSIGA